MTATITTTKPAGYLPFYAGIARAVQWQKQTNTAFSGQAAARIRAYQDLLPSGSGIDAGTAINTEASTPDKIVLQANFHHMDENGMYDGWSEHQVIITPSLTNGFNLKVTGRDRRQIKEYIGEVFHDVLNQEVPEYPEHAGHPDNIRPCLECMKEYGLEA